MTGRGVGFIPRGMRQTFNDGVTEELLRMGVPISQVIEETGCSKTLAYRVKDKLKAAGTIKWKGQNKGRRDLDD